MKEISRNIAPDLNEVGAFIERVDFQLPKSFIEFFRSANGAEFQNEDGYIILWPLTEMIQLNQNYKVAKYAPGYFIFGSDGGDNSYSLAKESGFVYEMPFIGMSGDEAILKSESFEEFLKD